MIIYGDGVLRMYGAIMDGRQAELMKNVCTTQQHQVQSDKLMEFRDQVRRCKPSEFREWYELYKDFKVK